MAEQAAAEAKAAAAVAQTAADQALQSPVPHAPSLMERLGSAPELLKRIKPALGLFRAVLQGSMDSSDSEEEDSGNEDESAITKASRGLQKAKNLAAVLELVEGMSAGSRSSSSSSSDSSSDAAKETA